MRLFKIVCLTVLSVLVLSADYLNAQVRILTIGDSTMADYDVEKRSGENEMRGWGQMLPLFLTNGAVSTNAAKNGRSSKSFYYEFWLDLRDTLKPGDYVFIQFGHNDEKAQGLDSDPDDHKGRGTAAWGQYQEYLKRYVDESRERGAVPVLLTPVVRCLLDENDNTKLSGQGMHSLREIAANDSTMNYPLAMRALARQLNVPLVDMTLLTEKLVLEYGAEKAREIIYAKNDNTHLKAKGGILFARLAVEDLLKQGILTNYLTIPSDDVLFSSKLFEAEQKKKQEQRIQKIEALKKKGAKPVFVKYSFESGTKEVSDGLSVVSALEGLRYVTKKSGKDLITITGDKWPAGDIDLNATRYLELAITPDAGMLSIDSISFQLKSVGGDGMFFTALGSSDSSFAKAETLALMEQLPQDKETSFGVATFVEVPKDKTFYLRIYPWYATEIQNKYLSVPLISISGLTIIE